MHTTSEYEYLLDEDGVLGVNVDQDDGELEIRVSDGRSVDEVVPDDFECEYDVVTIDEGFGEVREGYDILIADGTEQPTYRENRLRSVMEGMSEGHKNVTAGTAGPYVVNVTDTSKGKWADDVSEGDLVRMSNNHVYALTNKASLGDEITQPGPMDGGSVPDDVVGTLAGYLPIEDGVTADVAVRTADRTVDNPRPHGLPVEYGTSIHRGDPSELKGEEVCNTGRTLGVRWADVKRTGASVRVRYGGDLGVVTLKNQCYAGDMSEGGQSGSPVYREKTGELCGLLYAGSPDSTIFTHVTTIEENFGVEFSTFLDSIGVEVEGGWSRGVAHPNDRQVTVSASFENFTDGNLAYSTGRVTVPDGWSVANISGAGAGIEKDSYVAFILRDFKGGATTTVDVTFEVDDGVKSSDSTRVITARAPSGDTKTFDEETYKIELADDLIDYYSREDNTIGRTEVTRAMHDYNNGRISMSDVQKIVKYYIQN